MNFNDNKPIYLQIAESLMDSIVRGDLPDETRLPSVRDYAIEAGVNPNTVMRTFVWLQQQELIYMKRGIGYFVAPNASVKILQMRKEYFFAHEANYFFDRLAQFGITPEQLGRDYAEYRKKRDKESLR
ncbi:MAG: GntR family transcriptional regulator [Bacteroidales bacterium]|nr:GntR family transcriptional regulator [Bacteroidales bacterium]